MRVERVLMQLSHVSAWNRFLMVVANNPFRRIRSCNQYHRIYRLSNMLELLLPNVLWCMLLIYHLEFTTAHVLYVIATLFRLLHERGLKTRVYETLFTWPRDLVRAYDKNFLPCIRRNIKSYILQVQLQSRKYAQDATKSRALLESETSFFHSL